MAIELEDGTIIRSLPEQVSYNDERIDDQGTRLTALEVQVAAALAGVLHYKGSVATYGDLPATGNEVGDVWNVIDTGDNYAWDGSAWDKLGGAVDISNLVTLDTQQTITGEKTFTNYLNIGTAGWNLYAGQVMGHDVLHIDSGGGSTFIIETTATTVDCDFIPSITDSYKLGNTGYKWNDIFVNNVNLGTSGIMKYENSAFSFNSGLIPAVTNSYDIGSLTNTFKDLYLGSSINLYTGSNTFTFTNSGEYNFILKRNTSNIFSFGTSVTTFFNTFRPNGNNAQDIGDSSHVVKDIYLGGNLTDGTNSVNIADLKALIDYAKAQGWIS